MTPISPKATREDLIAMIHNRDALVSDLKTEVEKSRSQLGNDQYLVWSNEHRCWWRPNSAGYTLHVKAAGRYSREEALAIAKGSRRGWAEGRMPDEMAIAERDVLAHLTDDLQEKS